MIGELQGIFGLDLPEAERVDTRALQTATGARGAVERTLLMFGDAFGTDARRYGLADLVALIYRVCQADGSRLSISQCRLIEKLEARIGRQASGG